MTTQDTEVWKSLVIDTIREMVRLAGEGQFTARQEVNGVAVLVNGDSDPDLIFRDQQRAMSGYIDKQVGPYPKPELSGEEIESDARIAAENQCRWQERQAAYEQAAEIQRQAMDTRLQDAPEIELRDPDGWQKFKESNTDGYGGAVVTYAERWARLMQIEIAAGKKVADIAKSTSHDADLEGITGFVYGCAVSILSSTWVHGDELRRWHNLDTQIGTEGERANETGGVLNPAVLSIG